MNERTVKTVGLIVAAVVIAVVAMYILTAVTSIVWGIVTTLLPIAIFAGIVYVVFLWLKKRLAENS